MKTKRFLLLLAVAACVSFILEVCVRVILKKFSSEGIPLVVICTGVLIFIHTLFGRNDTKNDK